MQRVALFAVEVDSISERGRDEGIINETEFKIEIRRNNRPKVRVYLARKVNEKFFLCFSVFFWVRCACEIKIRLETETC